jgi:hypothetical protein
MPRAPWATPTNIRRPARLGPCCGYATRPQVEGARAWYEAQPASPRPAQSSKFIAVSE